MRLFSFQKFSSTVDGFTALELGKYEKSKTQTCPEYRTG